MDVLPADGAPAVRSATRQPSWANVCATPRPIAAVVVSRCRLEKSTVRNSDERRRASIAS